MNFGIIAQHAKYKDLNGETLIGSVTYENKTGSMNIVEPLLWDTFIQGTLNLVLEKRPPNLCICYQLY